MFSVRQLSRRDLRHHLRWAGRRALAAAQHHYLSIVSACILTGALGLALTSSALERERRQAAVQPVAAAFASQPSATPRGAAVSPTMAPATLLLVYYVVRSQEQERELEAAVQSDAAYRNRTGLSPSPNTLRYFLIVQNAIDAAEAAQLLDALAVDAPSQGYRLSVVDLR